MNTNIYRRIKRDRQITNDAEKRIITQYLKYGKMLNQDVLYSRQRGARSASNLQNNKTLSELLGYKIYSDRINIIFENLDINKTNTHEIIETNQTDKCMICGEPLRKNYPYNGADQCDKCNLYSYQGFNKHRWSFYEKGKVIEQKSDHYEKTVEDENLKLTVKTEIVETILHNCCCKWKEFRKKNGFVVDVYIKIPVHRPLIYVQNYLTYNLGNVEFAHDINPVHKVVLGWKRIPVKRGKSKLKEVKIIGRF